MTPRRLDPDSVTAKLTLMRNALEVLASVGNVSADQLRGDAILRGAVERYLTLLVDQAVAINLHIAAALRPPYPKHAATTPPTSHRSRASSRREPKGTDDAPLGRPASLHPAPERRLTPRLAIHSSA